MGLVLLIEQLVAELLIALQDFVILVDENLANLLKLVMLLDYFGDLRSSGGTYIG